MVFLTSAEIIASGSEEHKLFGIGSLIIDFYSSGKTTEFYIAKPMATGSACVEIEQQF
jgi:ABC-type anion transport system duplicated permease subunit